MEKTRSHAPIERRIREASRRRTYHEQEQERLFGPRPVILREEEERRGEERELPMQRMSEEVQLNWRDSIRDSLGWSAKSEEGKFYQRRREFLKFLERQDQRIADARKEQEEALKVSLMATAMLSEAERDFQAAHQESGGRKTAKKTAALLKLQDIKAKDAEAQKMYADAH